MATDLVLYDSAQSSGHHALVDRRVAAIPDVERAQDAGQQNTRSQAKTDSATHTARFVNYRTYTCKGVEKKRGRPLADLRADLFKRTGGWPKRLGDQLFVQTKHGPHWLTRSTQLFAWLNSFCHTDWASGPNMVSREMFFEDLRMNALVYDAVETMPHVPPLPGVWYEHPALSTSTGWHFRELLLRFCPATPLDAALIMAFLLTLFWGGKPGSRPAFLFQGADDDKEGGIGIGKSAIVELAGMLVEGLIAVSPGKDLASVKTRLLSRAARGKRLAGLDNLKGRLDLVTLEGLLTAAAISGHALFRGEASAPQTLIWCLTLNVGLLSRDMARRCVPIHLKRPTNDPTWFESTAQFIRTYRWESVADICAMLRSAPSSSLTTYSRWAAWEEAVLSRVADPESCQELIRQRQDAVDDDASEAQQVAAEFRQELQRRAIDPDSACVFFPSKLAAQLLYAASGRLRATNYATRHLKTLKIAELSVTAKDSIPGWGWRGDKAAPDATIAWLKDAARAAGGEPHKGPANEPSAATASGEPSGEVQKS